MFFLLCFCSLEFWLWLNCDVTSQVRTDYTITIRGRIQAVGTASQPITLTTDTVFQTRTGVQISDAGSADLRFVRFSKFGQALEVPCCGNARYVLEDSVFHTNLMAIAG